MRNSIYVSPFVYIILLKGLKVNVKYVKRIKNFTMERYGY